MKRLYSKNNIFNVEWVFIVETLFSRHIFVNKLHVLHQCTSKYCLKYHSYYWSFILFLYPIYFTYVNYIPNSIISVEYLRFLPKKIVYSTCILFDFFKSMRCDWNLLIDSIKTYFPVFTLKSTKLADKRNNLNQHSESIIHE